MNVGIQRSESCEKCLNLDVEFSKSKQAYNDLLNKYSQLEKHCISLKVSMQLKHKVFQNDKSCGYQNAPEILEYFENTDLKAKLKDKDTTICKLKDTIKSLRKINKEKIIDQDRCDLATINEELEISVAKLLYENKRLCENINHVKHDLKAQIQDKVFVITSLKNDLRKLKGKATVDNVAQKPSATTVAPRMFNLDLEHLAPKLVHNRESHIFYVKHTQDQAGILQGVKCSTIASRSKPSGNTKNNRISQPSSSNKINKVKDQPRSAKTMKNNKNRAKKVKCDDHVMQSMSNANFVSVSIDNARVKNSVNDVKSGCLCAIYGKCMIAESHYVVQSVLWYLDSGCSKHMTGNRSQLMNFVSKFLGTVRFGNDQIARIIGYGDYQQGNVIISRDLDKFDAKADIGIFVRYVPAKKEFRIYNRRTQIISKTIHVTFDEMTAMASEQFSSGPRLHVMTLNTPSTRLVSNPVYQQPFQEAAAPRAEVLADSPMSISISQDAPSTSIPSSQQQAHSLIISQANMIGDPSRSASTRKQLKTDAMWCYFDAFLTSVEPKNFKQAMTEPSWIDAMQEEIHEFKRLEALQVTDTGCGLFLVVGLLFLLFLMTYPVTILTLNRARSNVMQGASFTQGIVSSIPIGGSISPGGFLPSILRLVVIMVAVVIVVVTVILVVIVVVKVVIAIIGVVVVDGDYSGDIVDLIGDEDPTDEDGDTEVSMSLGEISSEGKKSWESDIGDCDNTRDGVLGQMTYPVTNLILDRARSYVTQGASFTQGMVSSILIDGNISPKGFLLLILLLVVIIVTVVIVVVILIVVVVIIRVVVVMDGVSSILKLLFVIIVTFPSTLLVAMPSVISHWMVARVMAGVSDVDVLLGGILST
nr:integrase, catalytic region, zinc finger, CCHC-type, peptidase aspartic, catalytic [Tanacetum cinerariifolium]